MTRPGMAWRGLAWPGLARPGMAWQGKARAQSAQRISWRVRVRLGRSSPGMGAERKMNLQWRGMARRG